MLINLTKNQTKKIKLFSLCLLLFLIFLLTLLFVPHSIEFAETKLVSANQSQSLPILIQPDIAGESTSSTVQLIDAKTPVPAISAVSVSIIDLTTNQNLYQKNSDQRVPMASTTKIMTALVASDYYKAGDILTVPPEALVGGSSMGLSVGENLTFRSLLYGMLLNSGNDAAFTIATNYPGGLRGFVAAMNDKAQKLNLKNSYFTNPAGFDDPNHYTSANDMSIIAQEFVKNPTLSKIVATKETSVISFDKTHSHYLKNLNKLLSEKGVIGIKTGFTERAGENLIGLVDRDGHKILTVVLNSADRFGETKSLIDWVYSNFSWK